MSAALAALAAGALAQNSYPAALDPASVRIWLRQATDISPEQVIAVSASTATALVSRAQPAGGPVQLQLRAEALTPDAAARSGFLVWEMRLEADCRDGRVRAGATTGYSARRSHDAGVPVAPASAIWRTPTQGTVLESAWRAACDGSFRSPLGTEPPPTVARSSTSAGLARNAAAHEPPTLAPSKPYRGVVQVVSSPSEADTRRRLAQLNSRFPQALDGLQTRIEQARVRGRTVYRGVVAGFTSRDHAAAFCKTLKRRGEDCLVR